MICELTNEILLIELPDIKPKTAALKQIMSTLPQGANPKTFNAAELLITPDGKFIYSLNQQKDPAGRVDDNTFAIYSRNDENDQLTPVGFVPSGGKGPRQFAFSPDKAASFIVVTCHESNLVTIHRRDATSGALNQVASVPSEGPEIALFRV
jgi:6-phosphogluconolactonase (cycloisomerase 2 family)